MRITSTACKHDMQHENRLCEQSNRTSSDSKGTGSHSGWHMRISFFDMAPTEDIQSPPTWEARRDLTPTDTVGLILTMAITRTGTMRTNFGANKMSDMKERSLLLPSPAWRRRRRRSAEKKKVEGALCCWQLFGFGDKWRDSSSREQKRKPNFIINFVVIFSRQLLARSFLGYRNE